jgi:hypothetical protein
MDNEGIDPSTFRMRNERSTTDLIALCNCQHRPNILDTNLALWFDMIVQLSQWLCSGLRSPPSDSHSPHLPYLLLFNDQLFLTFQDLD